MATFPLYDVHAHLADPRLAPMLPQLIADCAARGVKGIPANAARRDEWAAVTALSARHDIVYAALGVHPFFLADWHENSAAELRQAIAAPPLGAKIIAVGEIGLDFLSHRDSADKQIAALTQQLLIAHDFDLPVCLHNRKAWPDFFALLKELRISTLRGYCHHFGASRDIARKVLDLGLHLSFCSPIANPRSRRLRDAALYAPLNRILSETDCPDLPAPQYCGELSRPWQVHAVVQAIAEVKKLPPEAIAAAIAENWQRLFPAAG